MKRIFLLATLLYVAVACASPDEQTCPGGGFSIEVEEGRDLVGRIAYSDDSPAEGIVVSDGYSSTITDRNGVYQLTRHADARHVFFSYPEDCRIQCNNNGVPDFFRRLNRTAKGPQRQDFTLYKSD